MSETATTSEPSGPFWFLNTPEWVTPLLLMGLIGLIPLVGAAVIYGWALTGRDWIRAGVWRLPTASFDYLRRGLPYLLWSLLFALTFLVVLVLVAVPVFLAMPGSIVIRLVLAAMAGSVLPAVAVILLYFLLAALWTVLDREGLEPALNPVRLWNVALADADGSWRVLGYYLLGILIVAALGSVPGLSLVASAVPFAMAMPALARFRA